jgi:hypothetical protein
MLGLAIDCQAQKKFFIQAQFSPKLTINNNSGVNVNGWFLGPNNGPDSRSAISFGTDYSVAFGCNIDVLNSISVGLGIFNVNQIYRPFSGAAFRINEYKNIYTQQSFLTIPISFEHKLYSKKKLNLFAGIHLSLVGDVFPQSNNKETEGLLIFKNGEKDQNTSWYYFRNYLNMHTFNFLYGFSIKTEYKINQKLSAYGSAQFMQGFRPLITSGVTFVVDSAAMSHSISTTNGQSIIVNLGVKYNL